MVDLKETERIGKRKRMEVFAAMIDIIDQNIGRLSDLKSRGVLDNTLFLFCADNGGCPFEEARGRNLAPGTLTHTGLMMLPGLRYTPFGFTSKTNMKEASP